MSPRSSHVSPIHVQTSWDLLNYMDQINELFAKQPGSAIEHSFAESNLNVAVKFDMVKHACNPSHQGAGTEEKKVHDLSGLQSEFKAGQDLTKPHLKIKTERGMQLIGRSLTQHMQGPEFMLWASKWKPIQPNQNM